MSIPQGEQEEDGGVQRDNCVEGAKEMRKSHGGLSISVKGGAQRRLHDGTLRLEVIAGGANHGGEIYIRGS